MWLDFGPTVDLASRPDVGSYLIRTVPEPGLAHLLLVAAGISGLRTSRSRRCFRGCEQWATKRIEATIFGG
jgi:hypothetical protein